MKVYSNIYTYLSHRMFESMYYPFKNHAGILLSWKFHLLRRINFQFLSCYLQFAENLKKNVPFMDHIIKYCYQINVSKLATNFSRIIKSTKLIFDDHF